MANSNSVYNEFNLELLKTLENIPEEIADEFLADFDEAEIIKDTTRIVKDNGTYQIVLDDNIVYAFKFGKECVFEFCDLVKEEEKISRIKRQRVLSFLDNNTALVSITESHMIINDEKGFENAQVSDILFAPDGTKISTTLSSYGKSEHKGMPDDLINLGVSSIKTKTPNQMIEINENINKVQAM